MRLSEGREQGARLMAGTTAQRRRSYARSGLYGGSQKIRSGAVARAADASVPDDALTELEFACRSLRGELLDALGGADHVSPQQRLIVDVIVSRAVVVGSVARYVGEELGGAIVDRRAKKVRRLALDLQKLEDGLVRACQAIGLDRRQAPALTLAEYLETRDGQDDADHDHATAQEAAGGPHSDAVSRPTSGQDEASNATPAPAEGPARISRPGEEASR